MERSEPSLVPEWLRSTGSALVGGSSAPHFGSSSSHADVSSLAHHNRNRNSKSVTDFDSPRSAFLVRSSSSNSRRSYSNGSAKQAYSSFTRSHRDKEREMDKDRLSFVDHWDRDSSDPMGSVLRSDKDTLWRSHSMVSRKQGEVSHRRPVLDLKNGSSSNHTNDNGLISGASVGSSIQKAVFEKDFPSLGGEEWQGVPDIARVSSPGLSTAVQSLPVGSSALIGKDGWTSALAEVPTVIGGTNSGLSSAVQSVSASNSGASSVMAGFNMAEALTQAPARTRAAPQLYVQTQRLEELAIKQSRQLIPVTPSMPKSLTHNSSDKAKPKTGVRSGEMNMTAKGMQQQPSLLHPANQTVHGGHIKSEPSKTSHGKLLFLKPGRENGISSSPKDVSCPTDNVNRTAISQLSVFSVPSAPLRSPNNGKVFSGERKSASPNSVSGFNVEKRPSSQTQSRNDFFNLLKKKTLSNTSADHPNLASVISSSSDKSYDMSQELGSALASPQAIQYGAEVTSNGETCEEVQQFSEEEAAFLRSLGWEETSGEDEGLTEEEINAFIQQYMNFVPSLKLSRGVQKKLLESHATCLAGASSELSSSDSGSET